MGERGTGFGVAVRERGGDLVLAFVHQQEGPFVHALCDIFGMQVARDNNISKLIVETDCHQVFSLLHKKDVPRSPLGLVILEILCLASVFSFCSWSFVLRQGNNVAHY